MSFTDSQFLQLILALMFGLMFFLAAYVASEKSVIVLLVATVPFQLIDSGYGSLNTVLIYMVSFIFLVRGRLRSFPLLGMALFIMFAMFLATSQAQRATYPDHFFYMITIAANFLLFYLVYNYFMREDSEPESALNLLLLMGFLVVFVSALKLVFGFDFGIALGIDEFAGRDNIDRLQRFIGAFGSAGINGAFHATQILLCMFAWIYYRRTLARVVILGLLLGNSAFLVASGSRGAFLALIIGMFFMLVIFARRIGTGRAIGLAVGIPVVFAAAAIVMLKFTSYNVLFERLVNTEFEGLTPDTRDFSVALERIPEAIVIGHGPRLVLNNQHLRRIPGYVGMGYPHNLYLHILFTTGVIGLIAWLAWFLALMSRYLRGRKFQSDSPLLDGMPRLAVVLLIVFLIDELKIEFLRFPFSDYQQFMFALWGILLALSDRAYVEGRKNYQLARLEQQEKMRAAVEVS